jgi:hypothetical protein
MVYRHKIWVGKITIIIKGAGEVSNKEATKDGEINRLIKDGETNSLITKDGDTNSLAIKAGEIIKHKIVDGGNKSPMTAGEETKEVKAVLNMATKVL